MVFGGATLVVAGVACGGTTEPTDTGAKEDAAPIPTGVLYGAPPPKDAGPDTSAVGAYGAPPPDAGAVPPYGAPPPPQDSGRD